jgi:hypothetical protein
MIDPLAWAADLRRRVGEAKELAGLGEAGHLLEWPLPGYCGDDGIATALAVAELVEAAELPHNTKWDAGKKFEGDWTVVPTDDFQHLRSALERLTAQEGT